ncbi:hypothetical protein ASD25_04335 [Brevundimonas sp. Root1423]|nr:hypothetical protein ASD25_04335 [Brevundimonas sp. Root1423]
MQTSRPVRSAADETASILRGLAFAQARCAGCHAIADIGDSPNAAAPPLREISRRYPVEMLAEAFAEGINTGHSTMPEFVLSPAESNDLINYLESVQSKPSG